MAISQSIIADRSVDVAYKTKLIGYAYSAASLGYIMGPLLGGIIGSHGSYSLPFWVTTVGVLLLTVWILYRFKDHYIPNKTLSIRWIQSITAIKSLFNQRKFYKFYAINFAIFFSVQGLYRVAPLYVSQTWNISLHTYSLLISYVSLICFITNLTLLSLLSTLMDIKKLLALLLLLGGVFIILITVPKHFDWIYLTYGLAVIPTVMALPLCTTWLSSHALETEQGQVTW